MHCQLKVHGENCHVDLLCTEKEVYDLICSIDPKKSSGPDQILGRMLLAMAASITPAVTKLFNISIKNGTDWKLALVTPIPKSGDKSDLNNYRPISPLCILSKLLEKHIYNRIVKHVEEQAPISKKQWGFGKLQLVTGIECWHNHLESGTDVCAVFF